MHPTKLRVLIIDGHPAVGRGLKALVESMPRCKVIGLAYAVVRGLKQAKQFAPDVALVDADLPGLCSLAAIALLKCRLPRIRVVALGMYPERRRPTLLAGADDFLLKDAGYDALQAVINGPATDSTRRSSDDDIAEIDDTERAANQTDATRQQESVVL